MADKDKVIKSGQITLPRILFLVLIGGLIFTMVAVGGKALIIGYWLLTLAICVLLYMIATDYGVHMDAVSLTAQPSQTAAIESAASTDVARPATSETSIKRRPSRTVKRRR
jgi:hypothetical protein